MLDGVAARAAGAVDREAAGQPEVADAAAVLGGEVAAEVVLVDLVAVGAGEDADGAGQVRAAVVEDAVVGDVGAVEVVVARRAACRGGSRRRRRPALLRMMLFVIWRNRVAAKATMPPPWFGLVGGVVAAADLRAVAERVDVRDEVHHVAVLDQQAVDRRRVGRRSRTGVRSTGRDRQDDLALGDGASCRVERPRCSGRGSSGTDGERRLPRRSRARRRCRTRGRRGRVPEDAGSRSARDAARADALELHRGVDDRCSRSSEPNGLKRAGRAGIDDDQPLAWRRRGVERALDRVRRCVGLELNWRVPVRPGPTS